MIAAGKGLPALPVNLRLLYSSKTGGCLILKNRSGKGRGYVDQINWRDELCESGPPRPEGKQGIQVWCL